MKSILPVLVSIGLVLTLCSCGSGPQQQQQPGGISKDAAVSDGKDSSKSFSYPPQVDSSRISPEKALQSQFVSQNQAFTLKSPAHSFTSYQFTFQLKSTTVSKKLTGFPKVDIDFGWLDYLKATVDASGNLTGGGSYVYLDFLVKNTLPKEAKINLHNIKIVSLSADNTVNIKLGSSLYTFDKPQHDKDSRDFGLYKFRANEETTFRMLYIVPDTGLKTNLCLEVDPSGINGNHGPTEDYEVKRFIRLRLS